MLRPNHLLIAPAQPGWSAPERVPAPRDVSVAVITIARARNREEAKRLLRSLRTLTRCGWPVYVGDGGSDPHFLEDLSQLPHCVVARVARSQRTTLVDQLQRAAACAQAAEANYFLYTEPDKQVFFELGLNRFVRQAHRARRGGLDLLIAARSRRGFATFPAGQRAAESLMNQVCSEALGRKGDYTYGPLLVSKRLLGFLARIPSDAGWGWRFQLMAMARQLQMGVGLCTVPGRCPEEQRGEDDSGDRAYRMRQLLENMTGLANGWIGLLEPEGAAQAWGSLRQT